MSGKGAFGGGPNPPPEVGRKGTWSGSPRLASRSLPQISHFFPNPENPSIASMSPSSSSPMPSWLSACRKQRERGASAAVCPCRPCPRGHCSQGAPTPLGQGNAPASTTRLTVRTGQAARPSFRVDDAPRSCACGSGSLAGGSSPSLSPPSSSSAAEPADAGGGNEVGGGRERGGRGEWSHTGFVRKRKRDGRSRRKRVAARKRCLCLGPLRTRCLRGISARQAHLPGQSRPGCRPWLALSAVLPWQPRWLV